MALKPTEPSCWDIELFLSQNKKMFDHRYANVGKRVMLHKQIEVVPPSVSLENEDVINWDKVLPCLEKIIRTAYKSEDKITDISYKELLERIVHHYHHESTIEHVAVFTFRIVCDRGISHELVRHRIASFTQESTRYVNYGKKGGKVVFPVHLLQAPKEEIEYWYRGCQQEFLLYHNALEELKWTPQQARGFLPHFAKTEVLMTMNFRSLRNLFKLRKNKAAHPDMQIIANEILMIVKEKIDIIFKDIK